MQIDVQDKVYELRQERGLSLMQLSDLSGVSKSQVNRIENNQENPTVPTLLKISYALQVKPVCVFECEQIPQFSYMNTEQMNLRIPLSK